MNAAPSLLLWLLRLRQRRPLTFPLATAAPSQRLGAEMFKCVWTAWGRGPIAARAQGSLSDVFAVTVMTATSDSTSAISFDCTTTQEPAILTLASPMGLTCEARLFEPALDHRLYQPIRARPRPSPR